MGGLCKDEVAVDFPSVAKTMMSLVIHLRQRIHLEGVSCRPVSILSTVTTKVTMNRGLFLLSCPLEEYALQTLVSPLLISVSGTHNARLLNVKWCQLNETRSRIISSSAMDMDTKEVTHAVGMTHHWNNHWNNQPLRSFGSSET